MNKPLTLIGALWVLLLFFTITEFNWWLLTFCVLTSPFWKDIRNWVEWMNSQERKNVKAIKKDIDQELKRRLNG